MEKVDSFNIEFGYELLSAIPYAYELSLKGELESTRSGFDTESLYYFSPKHIINSAKRSWFNTKEAREKGLPYTTIHKSEQPNKIFPPYKEIYKNKEYKFVKPTLCICNRHNKEWGCDPINYFDEDILDWLFANLKDKYEIVYFPVSIPEELQDNAHSMELNDIEVAKKHNIKLFTDLCKGKSWNETMLKVFANCEHYITMNGGYSIMASMFSGSNIIYSKPSINNLPETREIKLKSFWRWYPNINNVRTLHVPNYDELKAKVQSLYIDSKPCLNILIRTNRPNYLRNCVKSIEKQTYDNINIVFICDSKIGIESTRAYNGRMVEVQKIIKENKRPEGEDYGISFSYNCYLDEVQKLVNGYIMFLDDDDKFINEDAAQTIIENAQKNKLLAWKVDFNGQEIIPSDSFGKEIKLFDITGIGFCYHSSQIKYTDWSEWKRADYRTAKKLSDKLGVIWLDEILTGIQDKQGMGTKKDIIKEIPIYLLTYPDGTQIKQYFNDSEIKQYEETFKRQGICITMID